MSDRGVCNPHLNRNINDFGGVPFVVNKGGFCHRGSNALKRPELSATDLSKRIWYKADGKGRDSYIREGSGGLMNPNSSGVRGSDIHT
jgi:hypothetical protein